MQKIILFSILLLAGITFDGCKKSDKTSDNSSTTQNGFKIGNIFYKTENGGIAINDTAYYIIFYSGAVSFDIDQQQWKGIGNAELFDELKSTNIVNGVPVGTFYYNGNDNPPNGFFTDGITRTNYNFTADTGLERDCIRGSLTISQIGTQFHFKYNLSNSDSSVVSGDFYGNPPNITSWFHEK